MARDVNMMIFALPVELDEEGAGAAGAARAARVRSKVGSRFEPQVLRAAFHGSILLGIVKGRLSL